MADDRPISTQQALLAVKAAGLDPAKPLTDQLNSAAPVDEATVRGWVTEAVAEALGTASQDSPDQPAQAQPTDEQQMGEAILKGIQAARTPWYSYTGTGDAV
jgi:hypothetical protein